MAADFPSSPNNGDTYTYNNITYVFDATLGVWTVDSTPGASGHGTKFVLKIPANTISGGVPFSDAFYTFDRGLNRDVQFSMLTARFGDGYEQRALDGTNTKKDVFNIAFANRKSEDIDIIAKFFDLKQGKNFDILIPEYGGTQTLKAICEQYKIAYTYSTHHTLTAALRRVYEP